MDWSGLNPSTISTTNDLMENRNSKIMEDHSMENIKFKTTPQFDDANGNVGKLPQYEEDIGSGRFGIHGACARLWSTTNQRHEEVMGHVEWRVMVIGAKCTDLLEVRVTLGNRSYPDGEVDFNGNSALEWSGNIMLGRANAVRLHDGMGSRGKLLDAIVKVCPYLVGYRLHVSNENS